MRFCTLRGRTLATAWLFLIAASGSVASINAQSDVPAAEGVSRSSVESVIDESEYDRWRGSSLGIRIERNDGSIFVKKIHEHVAATSPLLAGDHIVSVADIDVTEESISQLSELLKQTDPDTEIDAVVMRNGERRELKLTTYRRQLVDIVDIIERLKSSKVIKSHLNATNRPDFFDGATERMVNAVQNSRTPREAYEGINQIIDEIGVSHTAFVPATSFAQLRGKQTGDLGLTIQRKKTARGTGYFVIDRKPGSSGYQSDVKLGDRIISINQVEIEQSSRLILAGEEQRHGVFFVRCASLDEPIELEIRRRQNGKLTTATVNTGASVNAIDVLDHSARVINSNENRIGYVRLWNLMSMETPSRLNRILKDKFSGCHTVILDLRGRGGMIPVVMGVERIVQKIKVPVIVITDDLTRSAKEMLSLLLKKQKHVTVIGQKTAGAVTGATFVTLPSGNVLMFPVASSDALKRFTDGVIIEGIGVEPDLTVEFQIAYCAGNDRLLEAAIETANQQIQEFLDTIIVP